MTNLNLLTFLIYVVPFIFYLTLKKFSFFICKVLFNSLVLSLETKFFRIKKLSSILINHLFYRLYELVFQRKFQLISIFRL